jgi:outer membrane protein assembly factor BamB
LRFQEYGFGSGTSAVVCDGKVLLNRDADKDSELLAFDTRNGRIVWRAARPGFRMSWSTPAIWRHDGVTEVVLAGQQRAKAYDLKDGSERWLVRGLPMAVCTTPVVGDGMLYLAAWSTGSANEPLSFFAESAAALDTNKDGKLSLAEVPAGQLRDFFNWVDLDRDGFITAEEYDTRIRQMRAGNNVIMAVRPGGRGDITETHVVWSQTKGVPYVASPLFYRGRLFVVKDGGLASCFDAKTGKVHYLQERLEVGGDYYASPVAADGKIYAASHGGTIVVIEAADGLRVLARNDLKEPISATPAIVEGKLYVRTASHLFAFGTDSAKSAKREAGKE